MIQIVLDMRVKITLVVLIGNSFQDGDGCATD